MPKPILVGHTSKALPMQCITHNPSDFPGKYVARLILVVNGATSPAVEPTAVVDTLGECRKAVLDWFAQERPGIQVVCANRLPEDDPVIVETWL